MITSAQIGASETGIPRHALRLGRYLSSDQTSHQCHSIHEKYSKNLFQKMSTVTSSSSGKFAPKTPVQLNPPKDDPISLDRLSKCDGMISYLTYHIHASCSVVWSCDICVRVDSMATGLIGSTKAQHAWD